MFSLHDIYEKVIELEGKQNFNNNVNICELCCEILTLTKVCDLCADIEHWNRVESSLDFYRHGGYEMGKMKCVQQELWDLGKVYRGNLGKFQKPGGIDFYKIVNATKKGKESKKADRTRKGFWILREEATRQAVLAIKHFSAQSKYDLIATNDYLTSVDVKHDDVTDKVIESLET